MGAFGIFWRKGLSGGLYFGEERFEWEIFFFFYLFIISILSLAFFWDSVCTILLGVYVFQVLLKFGPDIWP